MITPAELNTPNFPNWCPGCGNFGIWAAFKNAAVKSRPYTYDASVDHRPGNHRLRCQRGGKSRRRENRTSGPRRRNRTIRARLFGHKLRRQPGQTPKILTMPIRPKVRR